MCRGVSSACFVSLLLPVLFSTCQFASSLCLSDHLQVGGLDKLKFEDVQKIKAFCGGDEDAGPGDGGATVNAKGSRMNADEKALAAESKLVWEMKDKIKNELETKVWLAICQGPSCCGSCMPLPATAQLLLHTTACEC